MSPKSFRNSFRIKRLRLLAGLLAAGLSFAALAAAQDPTYGPGENTSATTGPTYAKPLSNPWVVSDGTIITPAGTQVYLGITTRAKAVALNPNTSTHTAAVLQMGAPQAVTIFNTETGAVLQTYSYDGNKNGSTSGITYTSDGLHLLFSQDQDSIYNSYVAIVNVDPGTGLITGNVAKVNVPLDATNITVSGIPVPVPHLNTVTCTQTVTMPVTGVILPAPVGTTGSLAIPCGIPYSFVDNFEYNAPYYTVNTSYPTGIAISPDNKTAYVVLNFNNELAKIDLTQAMPVEGPTVRVGNVPHSVVISPDGKTAYVSNEAGRIATNADFQLYSNGTPVVAEYPTGTTATGTVSVVNLASFTVTGTIETGLHPTGMAFWGQKLLVANTYSDSLSVIDTTTNTVSRTIGLGLPIGVPFDVEPAYGAGPNSIAVDATNNIAYVALYNANAVAVVDLSENAWNPIKGMIPVGYAPSSVVLDAADKALLVANDKGLGTTGYGVAPPPTDTYENSYAKEFSVTDFETHQDLGTVSIVPVPSSSTLNAMTMQVFQNNHWDRADNIGSAFGGNWFTKPVAIPEMIGDPSLIKHVFLIIRENRTYDQILGDVAGGNGDASLAVFGDHSTYQEYPVVTPNAHALVQRFPLLDNFYDPSRQSADGHNWILQAMAPYSDDIQSPDWLRDYPSNGGDAIAYQKNGHLFDVAAAAGINMKIYGEYVEENTFNPPGCTPSIITNSCEPSWTQFYNDTLEYENGKESQLQYYNSIGSYSPLPNVMKYAVQKYPQFDLGIPDQYRFDVWQQDFNKDVAAGKVPQLELIWISSDHTGGPPSATAMQADNDLALGRFVDAISHSPIWSSSAIFVEEDDAQTGVDHVDGHRSPGYVISPYVRQNVNQDGAGVGVIVDSTFYTQVNMTRTIEQILGLKPMNQFDLKASPMRTLFVDDPPKDNFLPWTHVPNGVPLCYGVAGYTAPSNISTSLNTCSSSMSAVKDRHVSPAVKALQAGWEKKKAEIFAGKYHIPDSEDPDTVGHLNWYEATGFTRPYPGEKKVRPASDFKRPAPAASADLDD
jgi:YVTN family beta-propeller protein